MLELTAVNRSRNSTQNETKKKEPLSVKTLLKHTHSDTRNYHAIVSFFSVRADFTQVYKI